MRIKQLLQGEPLPDAFVGGIPRKTLRDFALPHVGHPWVLQLDIKDFYPSVNHFRVYDLFRNKLRCSPDVARLLTRLTTAERQLPQGFNTSTVIDNLLLRECIERLTGVAASYSLNLSVWIDNIVLSGGDVLVELQPEIVGIIREYGFSLHENAPVPRTEEQTICGVTVNTVMSYHKTKRNLIKAMIAAIREGNICAVCDGDARKLRRQVVGRVSSVRQVHHRQHWTLKRSLSRVLRRGDDRINWGCRCGKKQRSSQKSTY